MSKIVLYFQDMHQELLEEVLDLRDQYPSYTKAEAAFAMAVPEKITEGMDLVPKEELFAWQRSWFGTSSD